MEGKGAEGVKPYPDERLWVLIQCEGPKPTRHYIVGNGRTFPGRVTVYCPEIDGYTRVSKSAMLEMSPEAHYWMEGFLHGSEPPFPELDPDQHGYPPYGETDPCYADWVRLEREHEDRLEEYRRTGCWDYSPEISDGNRIWTPHEA